MTILTLHCRKNLILFYCCFFFSPTRSCPSWSTIMVHYPSFSIYNLYSSNSIRYCMTSTYLYQNNTKAKGWPVEYFISCYTFTKRQREWINCSCIFGPLCTLFCAKSEYLGSFRQKQKKLPTYSYREDYCSCYSISQVLTYRKVYYTDYTLITLVKASSISW